MKIIEAKQSLDKVIDKARVHLYKPIQIAEILHRDRIERDIVLGDLASYRSRSKKWRDIICLNFLGRTSTSSARYQDDIFNDNAVPPSVLVALGKENRKKKGIVEAYIYKKFQQRLAQMSTGLNYCLNFNSAEFRLEEFLLLFWNEPGLKRSIDKIYEIVVYSLFSALVDTLQISVEVSLNRSKVNILREFEDFTERVIHLSSKQTSLKLKAKINRVGVTNASDRGLDMWANFGLAIQVKHLSLTEKMAESIASSVSADRIVIVCKDAEKEVILSVINQIGWRSKIQSVITENDLISWYEKALRGAYSNAIGNKVLKTIAEEIKVEFPATDKNEFSKFLKKRKYDNLQDSIWNVVD